MDGLREVSLTVRTDHWLVGKLLHSLLGSHLLGSHEVRQGSCRSLVLVIANIRAEACFGCTGVQVSLYLSFVVDHERGQHMILLSFRAKGLSNWNMSLSKIIRLRAHEVSSNDRGWLPKMLFWLDLKRHVYLRSRVITNIRQIGKSVSNFIVFCICTRSTIC